MKIRKEKNRGLLAVLLAAVIVLGCVLVPDVEARADNLIIAVSAKTVKIGDTLTVTVSVPAGVSATVNLSYSSNLLTYSSASEEASVNAGTVSMTIGDYDSSNGRASGSVKFQAKAAGRAGISVAAPRACNQDGDQVDIGAASTVVTVKNESQGENEKSADNALASLALSEGSLSPAFQPDIYDYSAEVANEVTEVAVSAVPHSDKAVVESVEGAEELSVGKNRCRVTVKAENGVTATYTITITREGAENADAATEAADENSVRLNSEFGYIIVLEDADETTLPDGYAPQTLEIDGKGSITAYFASGNPNLCLVYAVNSDGEYAWYQYDVKERTYIRYYGQEETGKAEVTPDTESQGDEVQNLKSENRLLFWAFLVVVLFLAVVIVVLLLKKNNRKGPGNPDDEEDEIEYIDL